jgi:hypothetical protein
VQNSTVYFYSKSGNLLHSQPIDFETTILTDIEKLLGNVDWLANARTEGVEVEHIKDQSYIIRRPVELEPDSEDMKVNEKSLTGAYTEELIVADLNLLIGTSLHEADGSIIMKMIYKYRFDEACDRWLPKLCYSEEFENDPTTGSKLVTKTTDYYDNFQITTNL